MDQKYTIIICKTSHNQITIRRDRSHEKGDDGIPLVMMALVWGGTLNSSAANLSTAVKGAASGTLNLRGFKAVGSDRPGSGSAEANRDAVKGPDPREGERVVLTL
jgi:hypothetical protein